ncbi:site-specific DNA-methyltransferase [Fructobacillus evanidus]|uniref:Adenine specific DNA methylase Mod (Mod) n=1 Tax=Fructobacillus evanidus TaxID=3064281 RepID=A0ABM9MXH0_9LACO|nr:Adenine specific DNA methylase Mod (Mod) [Fructobacillus sp. LMG 32999]CAK1246985.1 Adenine specific DNA methylase Mod (Mod) [Fructobacillus sp. LMG 32999]
MIDSKIMATTKSILKDFGSTYFTSNGNLKRNKVIEDLDAYTPMLMKALLSNQLIHDTYTENVLVDEKNIEVFKLNQFIEMFTYKEYWQDSYTRFENKIGLNAGNKFIDETADVVLDFPFKDTVLKAGMTKEDQKDTDEVFLNETIAKSEIDELLEPKIFKNTTKYDKEHLDGEAIDNFDDDNLIIKGNNLIALYSLKKRYAGKVNLIYLDPPYNTGSDSFSYNDRFNQASWLTFIKNRLEIAKDLLSESGYIFIQTDDNEQAYLKVLMDSIFGKNQYINTVSILFKNIAGASGGGEDKRLKKNIEYITIYSKNRDLSKPLKSIYQYKKISNLVQEMRDANISWKYTSVLVDKGIEKYVGSTIDGAGNEIKLYKHENPTIKSINYLKKQEGLTEEEAYDKYGKLAFQTAMPQSSIRPRVIQKWRDLGLGENELMSIRYTPRTGRNKGNEYQQFYKGNSFRLFAWLKDVAAEIDNQLYKKDLLGTFWNFVGETNNVNKEGKVAFPNGKKPERLIGKIIDMTTEPRDLVLDFFGGSGSTAATAMKLNRRFIGVEQLNDQINLEIARLKNVIDGEQSGISKDVNWQGGDSFVYAELMEKNQGYLRDIQNAQNASALNDVANRMLEGAADLDFRVDLDKVLQDAEYQEMSLDDKKKLLIKVLDKNQLYYSYSNIDDASVQELMSANDIAFNKSFYAEDD